MDGIGTSHHCHNVGHWVVRLDTCEYLFHRFLFHIDALLPDHQLAFVSTFCSMAFITFCQWTGTDSSCLPSSSSPFGSLGGPSCKPSCRNIIHMPSSLVSSLGISVMTCFIIASIIQDLGSLTSKR